MPHTTVWVMSKKIPVPYFLFRDRRFFQWTPAFTTMKIKYLRLLIHFTNFFYIVQPVSFHLS